MSVAVDSCAAARAYKGLIEDNILRANMAVAALQRLKTVAGGNGVQRRQLLQYFPRECHAVVERTVVWLLKIGL
jgi:hypothetical protein